jgi:hypothetical protein
LQFFELRNAVGQKTLTIDVLSPCCQSGDHHSIAETFAKRRKKKLGISVPASGEILKVMKF